jgi:hypothetical protein
MWTLVMLLFVLCDRIHKVSLITVKEVIYKW